MRKKENARAGGAQVSYNAGHVYTEIFVQPEWSWSSGRGGLGARESTKSIA